MIWFSHLRTADLGKEWLAEDLKNKVEDVLLQFKIKLQDGLIKGLERCSFILR
jgi:hypothetical protein